MYLEVSTSQEEREPGRSQDSAPLGKWVRPYFRVSLGNQPHAGGVPPGITAMGVKGPGKAYFVSLAGSRARGTM